MGDRRGQEGGVDGGGAGIAGKVEGSAPLGLSEGIGARTGEATGEATGSGADAFWTSDVLAGADGRAPEAGPVAEEPECVLCPRFGAENEGAIGWLAPKRGEGEGLAPVAALGPDAESFLPRGP